MGLRFLWLFLPLLFATEGKSENKTISQIVIVTSPNRDYNGAFAGFDSNMTGLFEAAKKRNLKVVLIDADHFNEHDPSPLLEAISQEVSSAPSLLLIAAHGMKAKRRQGDQRGDFDTSFDLGQSIFMGEISDQILRDGGGRNLGGIVVRACHSDSPYLRHLAPHCPVVATSQFDQVSNGAIGNRVQAPINTLISQGGSENFGEDLRQGLSEAARLLKKEDRRFLLGPEGDEHAPVYAPEKLSVHFQGSGYQVVNHRGKEVLPCVGLEASQYDQEHHVHVNPEDSPKLLPREIGEGQIIALPGKYVPHRMAQYILERTGLSKESIRMMFPLHPFQEGPGNFVLSCEGNKDKENAGKLVLRQKNRREACRGHAVSVGEFCVSEVIQSIRASAADQQTHWIKSALNRASRVKAQKGTVRKKTDSFRAPTLEALKVAERFCAEAQEVLTVLEVVGIPNEVESLCFGSECHVGAGGFAVSYKLGECTRSGGVCAPALSGISQIQQATACHTGNAAQLGLNQACAASEPHLLSTKPEELVKKSEERLCYTSRKAAGLEAYEFPTPDGSWEMQEVYHMASRLVPSYECVEEVGDDGSKSYREIRSQECCAENGGIWTKPSAYPSLDLGPGSGPLNNLSLRKHALEATFAATQRCMPGEKTLFESYAKPEHH